MSRFAWAVAFLAGAAAVPAFSPVGFYPLAVVSAALLVHLWIEASPRAALLTGFAYGLGLFGTGVSWVFISLSRFGGMPWPLAAIGTAIFCALLAAFPAVAGAVQARIPAPPALRACLIIPAAWTVLEWMREWVLTGFPWLAIGYSATGWPLQGYAPVFGVYALSFLTVALGGMAWCLARGRARVLAAVLAVAVLAGGQALRVVQWTRPAGAPVPVALLQGNVPQSLKFEPGRYRQTLGTYLRLAEATRARLIVFPETALPRFLDLIEPAYLERLEAIARRNGGDLLLGVPLRTAAGEYFNSVVSLGVSRTQTYSKRHLVPFGEFVPPGLGWTMRLLDIPLGDFSRGAPGQPALSVAGQRVEVNICYEDAFGEDIAPRAAGATLLVNVSNVAWFGDSLAPGQHLEIGRMRAIETGRTYLTATNTGITAAIGRDGRVLARLPEFEQGRLEVDAQGYEGETPYMRWVDAPLLAAALMALVVPALVARLRRR